MGLKLTHFLSTLSLSLSLSFYPKNIPTNSSSFSFSLFAIYCPLSSSLFLPLSLSITQFLFHPPSFWVGSERVWPCMLSLWPWLSYLLLYSSSGSLMKCWLKRPHKICMWFGVLAQIEQRCRKPKKKKKNHVQKSYLASKSKWGSHVRKIRKRMQYAFHRFYCKLVEHTQELKNVFYFIKICEIEISSCHQTTL